MSDGRPVLGVSQPQFARMDSNDMRKAPVPGGNPLAVSTAEHDHQDQNLRKLRGFAQFATGSHSRAAGSLQPAAEQAGPSRG